MLKNLLSTIGVQIENGTGTTTGNSPKPIAKTSQNVSGIAVASPVNIPSFQMPTIDTGSDLEKFRTHFEEVFKENNLPGPDYFELLQADKSLESIIPDPIMRLKAAFKSLEISGLTKEKVVSGINHYISVVEKDKETFLTLGEEKIQKNVQDKINKIEEEKKIISEIQELIIRKQKEISERQSNIMQMEVEKQQAEGKISSHKQGYLIIFEQTMSKFKDDLNKISSII